MPAVSSTSAGSSLRGGSARTFNVVIEKDVRVSMRDGVTLSADVYKPAYGDQPVEQAFPVILERTPYDRARVDLYLMGQYFASRGYIVVLQDCRGRYDSDGVFAFYTNPVEHLDGYDTVEWIAAQPWCDGKVGTTGLSYSGANQQALAIEQPSHLATQVILDSGYNYWYRTIRSSGAFSEGLFLPYVFWMAMAGKEASADPAVKAALRHADEHIDEWLLQRPLKRGASPLALAPSYEAWYFDIAERGDYDDVWQNPLCSLEAHIDRYPDIPLCFVTSWFGAHPWANFAKFNALRERNTQPLKLVSGIWLHAFDYMQQSWAGEVDFGNAAALNLNDFRLRWFDEWLKGTDTGLTDESPLDIFVMGNGDGSRDSAGRLRHSGTWRSEREWPLARTEFTPFYLHGGGRLSADPPPDDMTGTTYTFDPSDPVPTIGGNVQNTLGGEGGIMYGGAFDQRGRTGLLLCRNTLPLAARPDVLAFRTEPLIAPIEVTGPLEVRLWVSSSAPDTDFTAKLIDEHPSSPDYPYGFSMNLAEAITRMRYRNRRPTADLIEPGKVYEIVLEPMPTSNVFGTGHRIRLDISSSNSPQFDVNPNTGDALGVSTGVIVARNTVFHDRARASFVLLPIIPLT
jgi:putative CocE/NonD family hydrolase